MLLDVADGSPPEEIKKGKTAYQLFMAAYFLMPTWLGGWRMRRFMETWVSMSKGSFQLPLFERENADKRCYMHSTSAYLYYYVMVKAILFGGGKELDVGSRLQQLDGLPILFVDGKKGEDPMRFYTDKFKKHMDERDYCQFVEYEDCGHWIMLEGQEKFNAVLLQFLQRT